MMAGTKVGLPMAESIAIGVQRALDECQEQFKWERWNCPSNAFAIFSRRTSPPVTREMAFVHAIVSAGITYTLAKNCSLGHFDSCSCEVARKTALAHNWTWGGCNDNVRFGARMAREFLDAREAARDVQGLVNLHNNRAGRLAVKKAMQSQCKCHGTSGSCATVTCTMQLSNMSVIARRLKTAYDEAAHVEYNPDTRATTQAVRSARKNALLYVVRSPDYCRINLTAGINGTRGRECSGRRGENVTLAERHSCRHLCHDCGLTVRHEIERRQVACHCQFVWCCRVECKTCTQEVQRTFCA
ncbi:protein Wnt-8b-like [Ornithodoros turicata]|uniref:protein Wnt-8b-like n=1 Tax=Ornithodoros turicata TaxID=34597 RepID=UPI003139C06F